MTLTTHAIAGAAVAGLMPAHPAIGFAAAFASHFLLDAVPHWDYPIRSASVDPEVGAKMKLDKALMLDMVSIGGDAVLGMVLSVAIFASLANFWIIFLGAVAGILPDPLQFVYGHFKHEPLVSLQKFHKWIHANRGFSHRPVFGIISQTVVIFLIVVAFKYFLI